MRSDLMKKGLEKAPHRSLFKAMGLTDEEIHRPMVGIANSANELIPGHIHLDKIAEAVKAGVAEASKTVHHMDWFEVVETRGHIVDGKVAHYQVTLKVGFRLED